MNRSWDIAAQLSFDDNVLWNEVSVISVNLVLRSRAPI
jgi:hypothetical protein